MSKREFYISSIVDYANKSGLILLDPEMDDLPERFRGTVTEERIVNPEIESYGLYDEERLVCFGGCNEINEFTAETYSVALDNRYRKTILKVSRMFCSMWLTEYHRLQTLINENNEKAYRFNELLGFEEEARLEMLTEDDYYLLRRLRDDD